MSIDLASILQRLPPGGIQALGDQLDAAMAERSLAAFIEMMWSVLEPGREMRKGWVLDAVCAHLEAVTRGEITRLLINVPPGFMKSMTTNVFWPAWEWGPKGMAHMRYVGASYNIHLTVRDNRRCRELILNPLYRRHWGKRVELVDDQNNKIKFENVQRGWKFATSAGGVSTGERGDRVIVDDPHSVTEAESEAKREATLQWFTESLPTRLNDPDKSAIIVIMQRVHERDVSGLILAEELGYVHLCIPMEYDPEHPFAGKPEFRKYSFPNPLKFVDPREAEFETTGQVGQLAWPERMSKEAVEELKKNLRSWGGTYAEDGQLGQIPSPRGGGMFKEEDFDVIPLAPKGGREHRVWDLAGTKGKRSPYSAGVKGKRVDGDIYITHVKHERWDAGELEERILEMAKQDGKKVTIWLPQDPNQAGKMQKRAMARKLIGYDVRFYRNTQDKEIAARPWAAQVAGGVVKLVGTTNTPWIRRFKEEHAKFPAGRYKDQVDAGAQLCNVLSTNQGPMLVGAAPRPLGTRLEPTDER